MLNLIRHEMRLIEELNIRGVFPGAVWDLVRFARSRGILCQGRGSAANSGVHVFALGITSVDPGTHRRAVRAFPVSKERDEALRSIDVDF